MPDKSLEPYQQRVVDERNELGERMMKLAAFIDSPIFSSLDRVEQSRLRLQLWAMSLYRGVLNERIAAF